jgi:hypothetical protein
MLAGRYILIADSNVLTALELAAAATAEDGMVLGPISSNAQGLNMAALGFIHGAILEVCLADGPVTHLANILLARGTKVVFHGASPAPADITRMHGPMVECRKPMVAPHVLAHLIELLEVSNLWAR